MTSTEVLRSLSGFAAGNGEAMRLRLLILLFLTIVSTGCKPADKSDFTKGHAGPATAAVVSFIGIDRMGPDETQSDFVARVKAMAGVEPHFAEKYSMMLWSCGFVCVGGAIVNVESGELHWLPFITASECGPSPKKFLEYRPESSLLVVNGRVGVERQGTSMFSESECGSFTYEWTGKQFRAISATLLK